MLVDVNFHYLHVTHVVISQTVIIIEYILPYLLSPINCPLKNVTSPLCIHLCIHLTTMKEIPIMAKDQNTANVVVDLLSKGHDAHILQQHTSKYFDKLFKLLTEYMWIYDIKLTDLFINRTLNRIPEEVRK